jgi:hypothetical protein
VFVRRGGPRGAGPLTFARVGLFFLAAGIWIAGVRINNDTVTSVAIVVAAIAIFMGWFGRRHPAEIEVDEDSETLEIEGVGTAMDGLDGEGRSDHPAGDRPPPDQDPPSPRS